MKRLIVVRHAKSSWKSGSQDDIDRPLNDRGRRDAPFMAALLAEKKETVEVLITSPAVRASTTASAFARALNITGGRTLTEKQLYPGSLETILHTVQHIPAEHATAMIVGHNPGMTTFVHYLGGKEIGDNLPTCGVVCFQLHGNGWTDIKRDSGRIEYFEYPKKYFR